MRRFFAEHRYPSSILISTPCRRSLSRWRRNVGVPVRIAHSHSESIDRDAKLPIQNCGAEKAPGRGDHYWACSESAGAFLFGEENLAKVRVVRNAVDS